MNKYKLTNLEKICIRSFVFVFIFVSSFFIYNRVFAGICDFDPQAWGGGGYSGGQDEMDGARQACRESSYNECISQDPSSGCFWNDSAGGSSDTNGVCGTANKTYSAGSTSYGSDTYCLSGTPLSSPSFPAMGSSVSWMCEGSGSGSNSDQCTAIHSSGPICVEGWSDKVLTYDTWVGSGSSGSDWCDSRPEGWCSPYPDGQTGGHDPSSKGSITFCCSGSGVYGWERTCSGVPSSCSITSFTSDNSNVVYGENTNLRFSLNGSFPWSISLLQGSSLPIPVSGVSAGGTSVTGNLTATQIYRLTCGDSVRDLVVSVGSASSGSGSVFCSLTTSVDNTTGNVTISGSVQETRPGTDPSQTTAQVSDSTPFVGPLGSGDLTAFSSYTRHFDNGSYTAHLDGTGMANPGAWSSSCTSDQPFTVTMTGGGYSGVLLQVHHSVGGNVKSVFPDNNINCGDVCSHEYSLGNKVTLQAIPSSSYWRFSNWSGDCSGTLPICVLNIDGAKDVTAIFTLRSFKIIEF